MADQVTTKEEGVAQDASATKQSKSSLAFIKDVAKYFMDFLETDFHRRKTPRRSIRFRNDDNLLVGLNLNKYPSFNPLVWKAINHAFDKDALRSIAKGTHKTNIPNDLLDLIKLQLGKITSKQVATILKEASEEIEKAATLHKKDYEKALNTSLENVSTVIRQNLVLPFVSNLEKPLEGLGLGDENSIYLMEEELTSVLVSSLESKTSAIIKRLLSEEKVDIQSELKQNFDLGEAKERVNAFFENFKVTDLFSELFEMERNKNILDKQEFYLYFCDITFNKAKYPIFYTPISLGRQGDVLTIEFDSQVYVNKKALEYIVQEYNEEKGKKGHLKTISERIIYLAQHENDFGELISGILNEIVNFFELDLSIDISDARPQTAKSLWTRISNNCYITLFDKSDEALVNDYEEILQKLDEEDSVLANAFNALIEDFIHKNPQTFNEEVDDEWQDTEISDRLVFRSPIPLNSEQLKIVSAIRQDGCKYITVEGPPGTGKSHTITAIVFDAILKNQSVLVLSDKKEALDVVETKITDTMNKVRYDKNFQNPILRLGKTGSTYSQILAATSIENIRTHYQAVKNDHEKLEKDVKKLESSIKEDIETEILFYEDIDIQEVHEMLDLESRIHELDTTIEFEEVLSQPNCAVDLEEIRKIFEKIGNKLFTQDSQWEEAFQSVGFEKKDWDSESTLRDSIKSLQQVLDVTKKVIEIYGERMSSLLAFPQFSEDELRELNGLIASYEKLRNPIFGYFLKGKQVAALDLEFSRKFPGAKVESPVTKLRELKNIADIFSYISNLWNENKGGTKVDCVKIVHLLLKEERLSSLLEEFVSLRDDLDYLQKNVEKYPKTFKKSGIDFSNLETLANNTLVKMVSLEFDKLIRYLTLKQKLEQGFKSIPVVNYERLKKNLEDLMTAQMTYIMDDRLLRFYDHNRADAKTLREIIRRKQKFPRDEFLKLKEAFPCILAGIRDYAEYIPLEPGIFDLVIIDEASQVSIAQAFPALLRAKKVLILGDRKQFSNVKSAQARTDTNREYLNRVGDTFRREVSTEQAKLTRLSKFNIKTSVLEFFDYISNYHAQLLKHFRGYKENISYSNKYFYLDNLQVMKIRAKHIDEVLKFSFIKHDGKVEPYQNTNVPEAEFIIGELKKLKETDSNVSVCIITPHTNQQKILMEMISKLPERDYFFDKLRLKIFTFDTCQGEERDLVFYSMVATEESDRLWGVFISDLSKVDIEEDGQIKAQRLNVGFSRSRETMHFVLSKPLEKFNGSIGEALRNYYSVLEEARKEPLPNEVDAKSPMEKQVLNWLTQTEFWKNNFPEHILLKPQFELGKYLRQLDKTYNHPDYEVDFLLVYQDETHSEHKIVIEYDGFEEHFRNVDEINEFNYQEYYSDEDVYRQKVLESYGYKFLRINRFNVGENPIATLDDRLAKLIKGQGGGNTRLEHIHQTVEGLQNKEKKVCPQCEQVRTLKDFKDPFLTSGYGRICNYCKGIAGSYKGIIGEERSLVSLKTDKMCPRCGSQMYLRTGRYGQFYGCSRFPYCRGTRPYHP